ncbi:hypothetical protein [Sagittula stellata]|uniref:Lipoprotein n=1 Tax=Sagittula stellata (strain ATCC 700073 / DSM 11524 / E-37) TaxID=388399 RepID=A3JYG3_SAGS3|nr:hypothetical protein [Sagittula stellata]EBA10549.1 hypothetical protein SSE37_21127 [Sagittula stellata E-37]
MIARTLPMTLLLPVLAACLPQDTPQPDSIPPAFQGRWGINPADCDPTRADAKGLLGIDATVLTFYESRHSLERVKEAGPDHLRATFAANGEGQAWDSEFLFDLQGDGQTLVRRDVEGAIVSDPLVYSRCT